MIALDPVTLTGAVQDVKLNTAEACCALIANESGYGLKVKMSGSLEQWLPAWTADLFEVPAGAQSVTLTPVLIGSLVNAPSQVALISLAMPGERFIGTYPMALARQMGISSPIPVQVSNIVQEQVTNTPGVVAVGGSGAALGDTTVAARVADQGIEQISTLDPAPGFRMALASYKPTAGNQVKFVAAGSLLFGTPTQVKPQFGQATAAGDMLIALVYYQTQNGGSDATTTAPGWVRDTGVLAAAAGTNVNIWRRPNCGANEAPPIFTATNGGPAKMGAQLLEYSTALAGGTLDQTGTVIGGGTTGTVTAGGVDGQGGDLIVMATHWLLSIQATATYSDSFNNGAIAVPLGQSGGFFSDQASGAYALVPTGRSTAALGVQAFNMRSWPGLYDGQAHASPAAGTKATVTLAANATKRWVADSFWGVYLSTTSVTADQKGWNLIDGASGGANILASDVQQISATAGNVAPGRAVPSGGRYANAAINTAMTLEFAAAPIANAAQHVSLGAYLQ